MDQQEEIKKNMARYGVTEHEAAIMVERGKVYGDPVENHQFIAAQITGLLSPWVHRIAANMPLPPHVIALILCALKMSRMRRVFHEDNYDDMSVYQKFARAWQREWESQAAGVMDKPVTDAKMSFQECQFTTEPGEIPRDYVNEAAKRIAAETEARLEQVHTPGTAMIAIERQRQIREEGYDTTHDDDQDDQELAKAAVTYINRAWDGAESLCPFYWPWSKEDWNPSEDPIRNLVEAGALIAAEIDRLQRAREKK